MIRASEQHLIQVESNSQPSETSLKDLDKVNDLSTCCSVTNCHSEAKLAVKVPSIKGKIESVSLCKKCHDDYQLQFWY